MDCWKILGIEKTNDKFLIKKAFARLAHRVSPEDEPEEYRRIHTAYKQALAYASGAVHRAPSFRAVPEKKVENVQPAFDFSDVITEQDSFSDNIEFMLDMIVNYKIKNGIDTHENTARWHDHTLVQHATRLLTMYSSLYEASDDISVWDAFFDEPVISQMINNRDFRSMMRSRFSGDTEVGRIIAERCDQRERLLEESRKETAARQEKDKKEEKHQAVSLAVSICLTLVGINMMMYALSNGDQVVMGISLVVLEVGVFCFCRFFGEIMDGKENMRRNGSGALFVRNILLCIINLIAYGSALASFLDAKGVSPFLGVILIINLIVIILVLIIERRNRG